MVGFGNFGFETGVKRSQTPSYKSYSANSGDPAYDKWAADTASQYKTSNPTLVNPEQYKVWQARNANLDAAIRGANTNMTAVGQAAAKVADPWASQRGQYQTMLSQLTQNPGSAMQNNPFFKWQMNQGLDAVNRKMAASGGRVSGNRMMALSDYAQNQSGQNFFQLADLYALLGGAKNQNPAAAASMMLAGARADQSAKDFQYGGGRSITQTDTSNFRPGYFV